MESRSAVVFGVSVAMAAASLIVVVLRFVSKHWVSRKITADDWVIMVSWLVGCGLSTSLCLATKEGLGARSAETEQRTIGRKAKFAYTFLYDPSLAFTKAAILVYYHRLFRNYRLLRWGAWITMFVTVAGAVTLALLVAFQCRPISAAFVDPSTLPPTVKCLDTLKLEYAAAPLRIITDIAILLLPMPVLVHLQLPTKQKVVLMFVFGAGGFVAMIQIVCVYYFQRAVDSNDFNWDGALSFMWACITTHVGIIAASIPMLKPLVSKLKPDWLEKTGSRGSTRSQAVFYRAYRDESPPREEGLQGDRGWSQKLDFYDLGTTKQAIPMTCFVTIILFMAGLGYGLLDILTHRFEATAWTTGGQALGMHGAYFGGCFLAPITFGGFILRKHGFKMTIVTGLLIYGIGCLVFWPSSVEASYEGISVSMFIIGLGTGTIECSCNPFIALIGPQEYAEVRAVFCQGVQAFGALVAILVEAKVLQNNNTRILVETKVLQNNDTQIEYEEAKNLMDIQWIYLVCAFIVFILAAVVYCNTIPELCDSESSLTTSTRAIFNHNDLTHTVSFSLAIAAVVLSAGVQEIITIYASPDIIRRPIYQTSLDDSKLGHGLMVGGSFIGAALICLIRPRWLLLLFLCILVVISSMVATLQSGFPVGLASYSFICFFQGIVRPTVMVLAFRGLGRDIKTGASFLSAAIGGGGMLPPVFAAIEATYGTSKALPLLVACYAASMLYPLFLNVVKTERDRTRRVEAKPGRQEKDPEISAGKKSKGGIVGFKKRRMGDSSRRGSEGSESVMS